MVISNVSGRRRRNTPDIVLPATTSSLRPWSRHDRRYGDAHLVPMKDDGAAHAMKRVMFERL
ncbi:hypothetical protein ACLK1T_13530 [Escherichia coli]